MKNTLEVRDCLEILFYGFICLGLIIIALDLRETYETTRELPPFFAYLFESRTRLIFVSICNLFFFVFMSFRMLLLGIKYISRWFI